jgi:hypothetical protein
MSLCLTFVFILITVFFTGCVGSSDSDDQGSGPEILTRNFKMGVTPWLCALVIRRDDRCSNNHLQPFATAW